MQASFSPVRAQEADTSQTLPNIAPQEVEIRGRLDVAFPSLERQPLVGFNPPPSTYEIPEDRRPFTEEYKQEAADLPASPLQQPELPDVADRSSDRNGVLEVGLGRFLDRRALLHARIGAGSESELFTHLDYRGSEGERPYDHETRSQYDRFDGTVGLTARKSGWTWTGEVEGFLDRYPLYGTADPLPGYPAQPDRMNAGATGRFTVRGRTANPSEFSVAYHAGRFETQGPDTSADGFVDRERRIDADGRLRMDAGPVRISAAGEATASGLSGSGLLGNDLVTYDGGLQIGAPDAGRFDVEAGARLLGFRASAANGGIERAYVAPHLRLRFRLTDRLELYTRNVPELEFRGLAELFEASPYVIPDPNVLPDLAAVRAEGGLHHYLGALHYNLYVGVRDYRVYGYHRAASLAPGGYRAGFLRPGYQEARIMEVGGTISYHRPGGTQAQVGVSLRRGRLTDAEVRIPYFAPILTELSLTVPFADRDGRITLRGAAHVGRRYVDIAQTADLGSYLDLDTRISYRIADPLRLFVDLDNASIGDLERWKGYPRPTYIARGGLTLNW